MPDRIPLRAGRKTPSFCKSALSAFGNNPYAEPNYRLIWSERKQIYFAGEVAEEYLYLPHPCWVLEVWTPPDKDAGRPEDWNEFQKFFMGEYPRHGTYNYSKHFPEDWEPSEEHVRLLAKGVEESKHLDMETRKAAIREAKEVERNARLKNVAEEIVDSFGSAEFGKVTQPVSGGNNVFRTADDFGRDADKEKELPGMPKSGGKVIN
jgi:hypothetical protein